MSFIPKTYTVESVRRGHPDKVCDQIADAILHECLRQDSRSRVAVEVFGGHGLLVIGGEVTAAVRVDYAAIARQVYRDIGYRDELRVLVPIAEQSPDIARGVDTGGAGDQGIMYGYATDETPELLPRGLVLVRAITDRLDSLQKGGPEWLLPDGKAQVTIEDGRVKSVLVSCQHDETVSQQEIQDTIKKIISELFGDLPPEILVNPTGRFVRGGFEADTGLTGRKLAADSYGGLLPHGGGATAGKDFTKVDRSGALMARHVARHIVSSGVCRECLVSVAYAIGRAEPVMLTARDGEGNDLSAYVRANFDFRPQAIIARLNLQTKSPNSVL